MQNKISAEGRNPALPPFIGDISMKRKFSFLFSLAVSLFLLPSCSEKAPQTSPVEWLITPRYLYATGFSQGVALARQDNGTYIFIDRSGEKVIDKEFDFVELDSASGKMFVDYYPKVREAHSEEIYQIDEVGVRLPDADPSILNVETLFTGIRCALASNGLMGLIDEMNQWVLSPDYMQIYRTVKGQFRVVGKDGNLHGFVKSNYEVVFVESVSEIGDFQEGYALVTLVIDPYSSRVRLRYNFIDESGKFLLDAPLYDVEPVLSEGVITFSENGKYGLMDLDGKTLVPPIYAYAGKYGGGLVPVINDEGDMDILTAKAISKSIFERANLQESLRETWLQ